MKPAIYFVCILCFLQIGLWGQGTENVINPIKGKTFQPDYQFQVGSTLFFTPGYGNSVMLYANPSVRIPVSKKFSTEAGIIGTTSFLPGNNAIESNLFKGNYNSFAIYGSAIYKPVSNLTVYGTGIKQLMSVPPGIPTGMFPRNSFTFGTNLKISNNVTIGASVHFSDGYEDFMPFPGIYPKRSYPPFMW